FGLAFGDANFQAAEGCEHGPCRAAVRRRGRFAARGGLTLFRHGDERAAPAELQRARETPSPPGAAESELYAAARGHCALQCSTCAPKRGGDRLWQSRVPPLRRNNGARIKAVP